MDEQRTKRQECANTSAAFAWTNSVPTVPTMDMRQGWRDNPPCPCERPSTHDLARVEKQPRVDPSSFAVRLASNSSRGNQVDYTYRSDGTCEQLKQGTHRGDPLIFGQLLDSTLYQPGPGG